MTKKIKVVKPEDFTRSPFWLRMINRMLGMASFTDKAEKITKDGLIKASRKATGLHDLGQDFQDEPLDKLIWSINHEADLHPLGVFISKQRLVNLLSNRLRSEYFFKRHPEILEQELYPVWIITGLQRTGTTKLHRLLAADTDNRVLSSWEAINPAPFIGENGNTNKRIRKARISEKALRLMAPGFFVIHPVEHIAPEEDILLLDITFLSTTPEATMHVPTYASWLEKTDQSYAYEYAVKLLKFLQWQKPAKRWILKSPHHLEFMNIISEKIPDVRFLWTHRDPLESIPSFMSMMAHSRSIFSDKVSLKQVAEHWVRKSGYMLSKAVQFRKNNMHSGEIIDIRYENLVSKAEEILGEIYSKNGGISKKLIGKFRRAEAENPPGKYGIHQHSLKDFGLEQKDIEKEIIGYREFLNNNNSMV